MPARPSCAVPTVSRATHGKLREMAEDVILTGTLPDE